MQVESFFIQHSDAFLKHYLTALNTGEVEAIHEMRVALKKIFALGSFLRKTNLLDDESFSFLEKQHSIFEIAGNLRDAQIRLQLLNQIKSEFPLPSYQQHVNSQIEQELLKWKQNKLRLAIQDCIEFKVSFSKKLRRIPDQNLRIQAKVYILDLIQQIEKILWKYNWQQELHRVRIRLKKMHQIYLIYFSSLTIINPEQIKNVELLLGYWHDYYILWEDLNRFTQSPHQDYSYLKNRIMQEMEKYAHPLRSQILLEFKCIKAELL